jgi:hypothetical protein
MVTDRSAGLMQNGFQLHQEKYGAIYRIQWMGCEAILQICIGKIIVFLSDHCDYDDLITVSRNATLRKLYHGFAESFADSLRLLGFDANPLVYAKGNRNKTYLNLDTFFNKSNS